MAPVEIQTSKPINPASASDPTKTTTAQPPAPEPGAHPATLPPSPSATAGRYTPSNASAAPSAYAPPPQSSSTAAGAAAAPGARLAAPTATATAAAAAPTQPYAPPPTRTVTSEASATSSGPPPPQPGAVPSAYAPPSSVVGGAQPPPPQPGAAPSPIHNFRGSAGASLSHPPGYQQNSAISAERASTPSSAPGVSGFLGSYGGSGDGQANLPLGGANSSGQMSDDLAKVQEQAGEAWKAVKGWAGAAGQKLGEVEGNVWKWVDGKSSGS